MWYCSPPARGTAAISGACGETIALTGIEDATESWPRLCRLWTAMAECLRLGEAGGEGAGWPFWLGRVLLTVALWVERREVRYEERTEMAREGGWGVVERAEGSRCSGTASEGVPVREGVDEGGPEMRRRLRLYEPLEASEMR